MKYYQLCIKEYKDTENINQGLRICKYVYVHTYNTYKTRYKQEFVKCEQYIMLEYVIIISSLFKIKTFLA